MNPESLRAPCAPALFAAPYSAQCVGRAHTAAELQAAADEAAEHEAAQAQRAALDAQLNAMAALASAGLDLLSAVRSVRLQNYSNIQYQSLAKYRKELQPPANVLGCKIVLVGDRTTATVVLL